MSLPGFFVSQHRRKPIEMGQVLIDIATWAGEWIRAIPLLETLLCMMAIDLVTGVSLAIVRRELNSSMNHVGACRKVVTLCIVGVCILLEKHMPDGTHLGSFGALFFIGAEGLSIIENAGLLGVPLPGWLKGVLEKFQAEPSSRRAKRPS